jgi:hypothetical protein
LKDTGGKSKESKIYLVSFPFIRFSGKHSCLRAQGNDWQQRLQEQYDGSFYERLQDAWGNEWSTRLDFVLQGNNDGWLIEQIRNESYTLQAGNKRYELSNHLGNLLVWRIDINPSVKLVALFASSLSILLKYEQILYNINNNHFLGKLRLYSIKLQRGTRSVETIWSPYSFRNNKNG